MTLAVRIKEDPPANLHLPVMAHEVKAMLLARNPQLIVDLTAGTGGHAEAILADCSASYLGLDRDPHALETAASRLSGFGSRVRLHRADFAEIATVLSEEGLGQAPAILADLGMSSFALDDPARGFSLRSDGPLDMRMDPDQRLSARDIVNEESERELARIIFEYGEERRSRRIARMIVEQRRRHPIETTGQLRAAVEYAVGTGRRGAMHPATRTFQALRIAVNHELESLAKMLEAIPDVLAPGGRIVIIAYHSLEDRPVKSLFRTLAHAGGFTLVTPHALKPSAEEVAHNPRARSARLRCLERAA